MSIEATRKGFEASFAEGSFYNRQTMDTEHREKIISALSVESGMRILDLGCGSGYLTFAIAKTNEDVYVTGIDIVTNTLIENEKQAKQEGIGNIEFVSYEGQEFPYEDESFDMVVTRYALHHFPFIRESIREVARILKPHGRFFISDPRPNDCDTSRFVDEYMQLKKDGHIKFYTKDEWIEICGECGMNIVSSFDSTIRFPKKKSTAEGFDDVISRHDPEIIKSYDLSTTDEEIWVTEQVNNIMFQKKLI